MLRVESIEKISKESEEGLSANKKAITDIQMKMILNFRELSEESNKHFTDVKEVFKSMEQEKHDD
jgi:hypothetical protein